MNLAFVFAFFLTFVWFHPGTNAIGRHTPTDEERLAAALFRIYDPWVRPVFPRRSFDTVYIAMSFYLLSVRNIVNSSIYFFNFNQIFLSIKDEVNEIVEIDVWIEMTWRDWRLSWNPSRFANLTQISLPSRRIWLPDIVVHNSVDTADIANTMGRRVLIDNNGFVKVESSLCLLCLKNLEFLFSQQLKPLLKIHFPCRLDLQLYPFDEHSCKVHFGSWSYDSLQVVLFNMSSYLDTQLLELSSKWDVIGTKVEPTKGRNYFSELPTEKLHGENKTESHLDYISTITCQLRFKRLLLLNHVINIFIPVSWTAIVALVCFTLPDASGEKITLGINSNWALLLFLFLFTKSTPSTSDSISILSNNHLNNTTLIFFFFF